MNERRYDIVIIGSGAGGGTVAQALAPMTRDGVRVLVLEKGPRLADDEFTGRELEMAAALYEDGGGFLTADDLIVAGVGKVTELRRGPPVFPRAATSPLDAIPVIGFHLVDAINQGLVRVTGAVQEFTETGARFADGTEQAFDDVILATGFAPALDALGDLVRKDAKGFALRWDRVVSADQPNLYFVGHNYDATGGLHNIKVDARRVARLVAERA